MADGLTRTASETAPQVKNAETGIFALANVREARLLTIRKNVQRSARQRLGWRFQSLTVSEDQTVSTLSSFVVVELVLLFCPEQKNQTSIRNNHLTFALQVREL